MSHTHTHKAPHTPPCLRDTTGQQRPGDNTHMRRGQLGPRQRKGAQGSHTRGMRKKARSGGEGPASMHSRGRGTGAVGQGCRQHPGTTKTPGTQPSHQENQQGVPPPPTHKGSPTTCLGHQPVPASPRAGPHNPAPPPGPASCPNLSSTIHPQQIHFPSSPPP